MEKPNLDDYEKTLDIYDNVIIPRYYFNYLKKYCSELEKWKEDHLKQVKYLIESEERMRKEKYEIEKAFDKFAECIIEKIACDDCEIYYLCDGICCRSWKQWALEQAKKELKGD